MKLLAPAATLLALTTNLAAASDVENKMTAFVQTDVKAWTADPNIISAVQSANSAHAALSEADILTLDTQWRAEVGTDSALIKGILDNAASAYLRDQVAKSGGTVTEVIVMDAQGLNAAISGVTSDYWQGDEDKHQKTYDVGPDAVHVSDIELDESTQTYQAQVSFTLTDPASGTAIGAVTVGLNAAAF